MEIVNVNYLGSNPEYQEYNSKDLSLINYNIISRNFGEGNDYIEYFINDLNNNLLSSNYNVLSYKIKNTDPVNNVGNTIILDPESDVRNEGYDRGAVNITYNFFRKLFNSNESSRFWISDISTDRTELRVYRQDLSNDELQQLFTEYNVLVSSRTYYPDFQLNFGNNNILIGVNLLFALTNDQASLLIKLYEPLPNNFNNKDTFWLVDKLSEPATYNIDIQIPAEQIITRDLLRGPNYNINISEKVGQTTQYLTIGDIYNNSLSSSYRQLKSVLDEKGYDINIDYTNFNNFIHFSSAVERISNFAYKVQLIEGYNSDINSFNNISGNNNTVSSSLSLLQNKIDNIVEKFDGYEYYLYFNSGSNSWPKQNTNKPYSLYSYTSSIVTDWLGDINTPPTPSAQSILFSASAYDLNNKDWLLNTIPEYLKSDPNNEPYQIFLSMIGQHFDNIWIYIKDITNRYNAENSLDKGISRDEIAAALKSLGIKLYTNTNISDNIFYSMLGIGPDNSLLPPTGSEIITSYITSSEATMPADDIKLEYYKRLYHNVPYLLKTKGTRTGLRALINCFGIPDTILRINEFGGSDKLASTPDLIQDDYIVSYLNEGNNYIEVPWGPSNYQFISSSYDNVVPDTIEFSFRNINGTPTDNLYYTQSLFQVGLLNTFQFGVNLQYNPEISIPGNPNQYYGDLRLFLSGSQGYATSEPISLPFFDPEQWWTLAIRRETGGVNALNNNINNTYTLYVKNSLYNYNGGTQTGFAGSSSIYVDGLVSSSYNATWNTYNTGSYLNFFRGFLGGNDNNNIMSPNGVHYQGLLHELRYWSEPLSESIINEHSQNLNSYAGNTPDSSLLNLIYRLPLGNTSQYPIGSELIINSSSYDGGIIRQYNISQSIINSYHPSISGTFYISSTDSYINNIGSIMSGSEVVSYGSFNQPGPKKFISEQRYNLIATPSTGLNQNVNNKINIYSQNELTSSLLSKDISIQILDDNISKNSYDIEVGFSPSDNINEDISNQLGYFNIDEYIGNPSDQYQDTYQDLSALRKTYFQKYKNSFKLWDFVRLLKYYDNSLFKMIKDFVPAKSNLSTGIIIKPHILERSKYKRNEPTSFYNENTSSIEMISISGDNSQGLEINTNYISYNTSSLGYIIKNNNDSSQPFTGEYGGSQIPITNGEFLDFETSNIISKNSAGFVTYSLVPLMNNISSSRKSSTILDIDYSSNPNIPVNNGLISEAFDLYEDRQNNLDNNSLNSKYYPFAEIEDYGYNIFSYSNPRYNGSKVSSQNYNLYSNGDDSYGKTAAVDHFVKKIGLFTQIESSSFFLNRNSATLTHLVDENGSYTSLDRNNNNWIEVQNTFKYSPITVNLFDAKKYSNQKFTNGQKELHNVGYTYEPIFYLLTGSLDQDLSASFDSAGDQQSQIFATYPLPGSIGTGSQNFYSASINQIGDYSIAEIFRFSNREYEYNDGVFTPGSNPGTVAGINSPIPAKFTPPATNKYSFETNLKLFVDLGIGNINKVDFKYLVLKNTSAGIQSVLSEVMQSFSGGQYYRASLYNLSLSGYTYTVKRTYDVIGGDEEIHTKVFNSSNTLIEELSGPTNFEKYTITYNPIDPVYSTKPYKFDPTSQYSYSYDEPFYSYGTVYRTSFTIDVYKIYGKDYYVNITLNDDNTIKKTYISYGNVNILSNVTNTLLSSGDTVTFDLQIINTPNSSINLPSAKVSLLDGSYLKNTLKGATPVATGSFLDFDTDNSLILIKGKDGSLANLYGGSYVFLPSGSIYSNSLLYEQYGDVNYTFNLTQGDIIVLNTQSGSISTEYTVVNTPLPSTSEVAVKVTPPLPQSINVGTLYSAVFLKKIVDETNIYLNFKKRPGKTSYGFLIPSNVDPNLLKNIDQISKEIQSKLLSNQSDLTG